MSEIRIYVASLSDYNNGVLHGRWIDATIGEDHIQTEVADMLRESKYPNVTVDCPDCYGTGKIVNHVADTITDCTGHCGGSGQVASAEEWAIHDYEGFGDIRISESESFETVAELAAAIEEHGAPFIAWYGNDSRDYVDVEAFHEQYTGEWDSIGDFAADLIEQTHDLNDVPEFIRFHIDWDGVGRDLELGGDFWTADTGGGRVYVFRNE